MDFSDRTDSLYFYAEVYQNGISISNQVKDMGDNNLIIDYKWFPLNYYRSPFILTQDKQNAAKISITNKSNQELIDMNIEEYKKYFS